MTDEERRELSRLRAGIAIERAKNKILSLGVECATGLLRNFDYKGFADEVERTIQRSMKSLNNIKEPKDAKTEKDQS